MSELRQSLDDYLALRRSARLQARGRRQDFTSFVAFAERDECAAPSAPNWPCPGRPSRGRQARSGWPTGSARCAASPPTCTRSTPPPRSRPADLLAAGYQPAPLTCTPTPMSPLCRRPRDGCTPPLWCSDVRDTAWAAGDDGHAHRGGDAARPRPTSTGTRECSWSELEVRAVTGGGVPRQHRRSAQGLRRPARPALPRPSARRASSSQSRHPARPPHVSTAPSRSWSAHAGLRPAPAAVRPRRPRFPALVRHEHPTPLVSRRRRRAGPAAAALGVLGHVRPASTFWYLTASPELLALAAGRLEGDDEEHQR